MLQIIFHLLNINLTVFLPFLRHTIAAKRILIIRNRLLHFSAPVCAELISFFLGRPQLCIRKNRYQNEQHQHDYIETLLLDHLDRFILN
ncbi:hypothetical protein D3C77_581930 [compost metagenome]